MAPPADVPIIDSHIHLYPASELSTLAWCTPESPLAGQRSVAEYRAATDGSPAQGRLKGFVFLETDRKTDEASPDPASGWKYPLMEVDWLRRIATGEPREGEGHAAADAALCLGIVPWAPMPAGEEALQRYIAAVRETAGPRAWDKVKGFRYLLQDKPNGTMLKDPFIESLKLLGREGFVFDTGVDQHRRGRIQLEECVEMIDRAHEDVAEEHKVKFIINHLCKPDLTIINPADPAFIAWRTAMYTLSKCSQVYMKVSGGFPEMSDALKQQSAEEIFESIMPWLAVILAAFGPSRLMFASDWPVCTLGVEKGSAWEKWRLVVERLCDMASLSDEEQAMIWSGTAAKAYNL